MDWAKAQTRGIVLLVHGKAVMTRSRDQVVLVAQHDDESSDERCEIATSLEVTIYWEARLVAEGGWEVPRERTPPSATRWRRTLGVCPAAVARRLRATLMKWGHPKGGRLGNWVSA